MAADAISSGAGQEPRAQRWSIVLCRRLRAWYLGSDAARGYLLLMPTLAVLFALLVVPVATLFLTSFCTQVYFKIDCSFTLANYATIFEPSGEVGYFLGIVPYPEMETPIYAVLLVRSIWMAFLVTLSVMLLAYPMAYFLAFRVTRNKIRWLILITVPFWTSYLLRAFAWKVILGYGGVINSGLISAGIIQEPLSFLLYNPTAVIITLTHAWLAFAVLPIYVSLEKIDRSLLEAASDLGDSRIERFLRITLPLSMPGVVAASLLVFIPTVGEYVTPTLVGGSSGKMLGSVIQSLFGQANNQPLGSAVSLVMMLVVTLLVCAFLKVTGSKLKAREVQDA
ncbi:ABC transporter permease [Dongia deserti]|uniref:ABC transporter permease n=1 Tax=Dongia deserti TaxID=2268030 RepID=UPI000E656F3A|nr:ABC transporter permease [Dongia deserti]